MRLADIASHLQCDLQGDGSVEITGIRGIEEAREGDLTFVAHPRYLPLLTTTRASAVIVTPEAPPCARPTLRTPSPHLAFARALTLFFPPVKPAPGVHPSAVLAPGVLLEEGVSVGAHAVIEEGARIGAGTVVGPQVFIGRDSWIGRECLLYPQVVIRAARVGDRVIIHSGTVIGSDGFGYVKDKRGRHVKIPQVGRVVIGDDVEIGANVTIDRATVGETRIGRGTKIDNLVQIGHNVTVGEDAILVAQVGISGSSSLGNRVLLAGQAGLVDHVTLGDDVVVGAQAGVTKDISPGSVVLGSPALPQAHAKRILVASRHLPDLLTAVRQLESTVREISERLPPVRPARGRGPSRSASSPGSGVGRRGRARRAAQRGGGDAE